MSAFKSDRNNFVQIGKRSDAAINLKAALRQMKRFWLDHSSMLDWGRMLFFPTIVIIIIIIFITTIIILLDQCSAVLNLFR